MGARFSASRDSIAARSRGQIDLFRARRERAELEGERTRALQRLGHSVFYEDETGIEASRAAVQEVVDKITAKEAEIQALIDKTEERVQRAQAGVRPTEKMESPPEPARIPEPWPPPDEGDPPEPAVVPEPSPDQPAPDPEPAPTPQAKARGTRKDGGQGQEVLSGSHLARELSSVLSGRERSRRHKRASARIEAVNEGRHDGEQRA